MEFAIKSPQTGSAIAQLLQLLQWQVYSMLAAIKSEIAVFECMVCEVAVYTLQLVYDYL